MRELPGYTQEVNPATLQAFLRKLFIAAFHTSFLPPCLFSAVPIKNVSLSFRMDPGFEQQGHPKLPMLCCQYFFWSKSKHLERRG